MNGVLALAVLGLLPIAAHYYWEQFGEEGQGELWPLTPWAVQGLLTPAVLWTLFNCGLVPAQPCFVLEIEQARAAGVRLERAVLEHLALSYLGIGACWSAVTLGHLLAVLYRRLEQPRRDFLILGALWGLLLLPVAALLFFLFHWGGLLLGVVLWQAALAHYAFPLAYRGTPRPFYSKALARLKFGKYREAEQEVLNVLEQFEDDVEGWLMLAEMYATQFKDLPAAAQTIGDLCDQPNVSTVQMALAFQRVADWQLKEADDPAGARAALLEILRRAPGSHAARMAELRLQQLPRSREHLLEQRQTRPVRLPALGDALDREEPPGPTLSRTDAAAEANRCVARLKEDPNAIEPRERLARLFAEELGQVDLGLEQLGLLRGLPDAPEAKLAEWLGLMAAWQLRLRQDRERARALLQKLVQDHPRSVQAFAAQRRLKLLDVEDRMRAASDRSGGG